MTILAIDIGGTNIQMATWSENTLSNITTFKTPETYALFEAAIDKYITDHKQELTFEGIAISSPGVVDEKNKVIRGLSAVPFIHTTNLWQHLEDRFGLSVTIANDANCSGIAEMKLGIGKEYQNVVFFVVGTGIGGAIFINGELYQGSHLVAGEFGMMGTLTGKNLSQRGSVSNMARLYHELQGDNIDGAELYALAESGDPLANELLENMYDTLTEALFDLQVILDPEIIIIGGGISERTDYIQTLQHRLQQSLEQNAMHDAVPHLVAAKYKNHANLIGAALHYERS